MDEHELAWAAGFFDGDGWAALVRQKGRRSGRPQARINQSSVSGVPEVLLRFRDAVGVGRIGGPKIENGREPLYWWIASSRGDVLRTGTRIGPWLSLDKRGQFGAAVGLSFEADPVDSFAWAAGLFDAEGSTSLSDHRSHAGYKVIDGAITQGGARGVPMELVRFQHLVGVGHNYGPYAQEGANAPIYRWRSQTVKGVRTAIHVMLPWLGEVKRRQALSAFLLVDGQPTLPRGRPEWGSYKTRCIHGHEYATGRIRPYVSRGSPRPPRENHRCLTCLRELARRKRELNKEIGGLSAADQERDDDGAIC